MYIPTVLENAILSVPFDRWNVLLAVWDTFAGGDYTRLRALSYPQTDAFLVYFDVFSQVDRYWCRDKTHC